VLNVKKWRKYAAKQALFAYKKFPIINTKTVKKKIKPIL
jgi:hypothetical protein